MLVIGQEGMVGLPGFPERGTGTGEEFLPGLPDDGPLIGKEIVLAVLIARRHTTDRPEDPQRDKQLPSGHSLTLTMVGDAVHLSCIQKPR